MLEPIPYRLFGLILIGVLFSTQGSYGYSNDNYLLSGNSNAIELVQPEQEINSNIYWFSLFNQDSISEIRSFQIPVGKTITSASLYITAYNGDPTYPRSVFFTLDGIGTELVYGLSKSFGEGWIPPMKSKNWTFDLSRPFVLPESGRNYQVNNGERYLFKEYQYAERNVSYLEFLNKNTTHQVNCRIIVPEEYRKTSWITVKIKVKVNDSFHKLNRIQPRFDLIADSTSNYAVQVALKNLRKILSDSSNHVFTDNRYIIGMKTAEGYLTDKDKFVLSELGSQGFIIKTLRKQSNRIILVSANTDQGVAYGIFRLIHFICCKPNIVNNINIQMKPAVLTREIYEEHTWGEVKNLNIYKSLLENYLAESINVLDLPAGWFLPPPDYLINDNTAREGGPNTMAGLAITRKVIDYAHSLGIRVFICENMQLNPLLNEKKENLKNLDITHLDDIYATNSDKSTKDPMILSLSNETAIGILRENRMILYRELNNADGVVIHFADPGGDYCAECQSWGETVIRQLKIFYIPLIMKANPKMKITLSLWGAQTVDTEYIITHIKDLPSKVECLQIPPTHQVTPPYLIYDDFQVNAIKQSAHNRKVVLQQFFEGIGFRDAWVNIWEHPMPRLMSQNFLGAYTVSRIDGVYGSSFEFSNQLIDTRLLMEWAWNPKESSESILTEFGDEQFGLGVGREFSNAMLNMELYWDKEAKRFHFDTNDVSNIHNSVREAQDTLNSLVSMEPLVTKNKLYYAGYVEQAEIMLLTARQYVEREKAEKLLKHGDKIQAVNTARKALADNQRILEILRNSKRYSFLLGHFWWKEWSLGKRSQIINYWITKVNGGMI